MSTHEENVSTLEDVHIVAFLITRGFRATPFIKDGGVKRKNSRVAWTIEGDIKEALNEYYNGQLVDVYGFVKALKDVRAEMYNMKQVNGQKS